MGALVSVCEQCTCPAFPLILKSNCLPRCYPAGAGSTANHAVNAHSWPYFHKAAGESGMFAMWNAMPLSDAEETFSAILEKTLCTGATDHVACLEQKTTEELTAAASLGLFRAHPWCGRIMWGPVIDGIDVIGHPWELAQRGHHFKGPLLLGTARDEGVSFCGTPGNMSQADFEEWAVGALKPAPLSDVTEMYRGHPNTTGVQPWTNEKEQHSEWYWASAKLVGDANFHCGSRFGAQWLSRSQPVFLYSYTPAAKLKPYEDSIGHCSENGFIQLAQPSTGAVSELEAAMGQYWYSFAKHGNPSTARLTGSPLWPVYSNKTDLNIAFDVPIRTETGLRKKYCDACAKTTTCQSHTSACV
jgi:carboxylesterase type B